MTAPLLTPAIRDQLIAAFRINQSATAEIDHIPAVKLFTPDAQATWLFTELDPCQDLLFGLYDLGVGCPELGYASLEELARLSGPLGLPIERDRWFEADRTLNQYAKIARQERRILA